MRKAAVCGTNSGYMAHYRRGEKACDPCAEARRIYGRSRYAVRPKPVNESKLVRYCTVEGCAKVHLARGMCGAHYWLWHHAENGRPAPARFQRTCEMCSQDFETTTRKSKLCSEKCVSAWFTKTRTTRCPLPDDHPVTALIAQEDRVQAQAKADELEAKRRSKASRPWRTPRQCRGCASWFCPLKTPTMMDCSSHCARKVGRRARRAREYGAPGSWVWSDFMRIARKFGFCCAYCGDKPGRLDPDHVVPLSRGGYDSAANLLPACPPCNGSKHALSLDEWATWRAERGLPPRNTSWAPEDKRYTHLTQVLLAA